MRRALLACLVLLACVATSRADGAKVEPKQTYRQALPGVIWVVTDSSGEPVFRTADGYHVLRTGKFLTPPKDASWGELFIDRAGRIWGLNYHQSYVHYWTGSAWEKREGHPVKLFEDSAGRVFHFDGAVVHVLGADGKWASQRVTKGRHQEDMGFAQSGQRVWLWGSREKPGSVEGMLGLWSYSDGKWAHHTAKDGLPFDAVKWLHPLDDGRFLLIRDYAREVTHTGNAIAYWHPDRKLKEQEKVVFRDKELFAHGDVITGTDGTLYVGTFHTGKSQRGMVAATAKGEIHHLTAEEQEAFRRLPQARVQRQYVVYAKFGEPRPVLPAYEGDFLCADGAGRYYYRGREQKGGKPNPITVVWPKHEKPGEVMRLTAEKPVVRNIVADEVGKIWAEPYYGGGLRQLHAGKWTDTPVLPLYHPAWTNRGASPWNDWTWNTRQLFRLHGKNGDLLVVRLRDIYQSEDPPIDRFTPPPPIRDPKFPHPAPPPPVPAGAERPKYWLEAWLFRGGKWSGPTEIHKLLATESAALLADFPTQSGTMSYFAYVNDVSRLWVAFDGKLLTCDKSGKLTETEWPLEKPKRPAPHVMLGKLPGGKVLLTGHIGDGFTLSVSPEGKIASEAFTLPERSAFVGNVYALSRWKLAKDNTLWFWTANYYGSEAKVWHYRDGKWSEKKGLGAPFHEDADGNLWCHPEPRLAREVRILIANGTETKELRFPLEEQKLGLTEIPQGAVAWAASDRLFCLDSSSGKPVLRWCQLSDLVGYAPVVLDKKGTVLLGSHRGQLVK